MKAITTEPKTPGSTRWEDVPEPVLHEGSVLLRNNVVVGSVNANKRHWYKAGQVLAHADRAWLSGLVTRRERPEDFAQAPERRNDDIKVVVQFADA